MGGRVANDLGRHGIVAEPVHVRTRSRSIDKGTISRYLHGKRVPREPWFLDKLLAIQAGNGKPVTPAVREHLKELHLRALETTHPHEYRVRLANDELKIALTSQRQAERYARDLEEQIAEHNRQVLELTEDKDRLQEARDADYERLTREIGEITGELNLVRERAVKAERLCQLLEDIRRPSGGDPQQRSRR